MRWPYEKIGVTTTRSFRNLLNKIHGDISDDMQEHKDRADNIQAQVDNLVADGDSSPEAAQARVGADGTNYTTLKQRLDTEHGDVTAQLADNSQQISDLNKKQIVNAKDTFGTFENAVISSVIANGAGGNRPQILGITQDNDYQLATYDNRDSVTHYRANSSRSPLLSVDNVDYTVNSVTVPDGTDLSKVSSGMIIDTKHKPKFSGLVSAVDGRTIYVYNWYQMGNTAKGQVPTNDYGVYISPVTKIWVDNLNLFLNEDDPLTAATMMELGFWNNKVDGGDTTGIDMVSHGLYRPTAAHKVRGTNNRNRWMAGFLDKNSSVAFQGDNTNMAENLLFQSASGFFMRNSGLMNRLKLAIGNSSLSTTINPENVTVFLISNPVAHYIVAPSSASNDICLVFNITSSDVPIGGQFNNPTTTGSITVPTKSLKIIVSDGNYWYHS